MKVRQKEKTSNRSPEKGDNPSEKAIKEREINELNVYIIFLASLMVILMCSLVYRLAKPELDEFPRSRPESPFEVEDKPFTK